MRSGVAVDGPSLAARSGQEIHMNTRDHRSRTNSAIPFISGQLFGQQRVPGTGKLDRRRTFKNIDSQPGPGQKGQHPRKGEPFGSTPGEVRGHPGGKKGQAKSGQRGTARGRNAPRPR